MAFDKAKVIRAAEKYLAQGKIPAAIKEYRQIVEHDETDFTVLNMLGDLYVRTGKPQEAIQCFARIAEHYHRQGFALKAIAMYRKIDRLSPGDPEIAGALAELYETQGQVVEARAQYLVIAESYTRNGNANRALDVFRKIADLDPQNTEIRLKLAEGYLRENLPTEAARAFTEAGAQLRVRGSHERALEAYQRALELAPEDIAAMQGLVETHIALGTADEAAEFLERALDQEPDNSEFMRLLARAYFEAQDAAAAEYVTATLVERKVWGHEGFVDVARLYLKLDDAESAVRVLTNITEQMLSGREENQLMELLTEVLARNPEQINALRLLIRIYAWQRDDEKMRAALERLLDAAEASGLKEEERYALEQLVRLTPERTDYIDRLYALGGAPEERGFEEAAPMPSPPAFSTEIPTFETFSLAGEETAPESFQEVEAETGFGMIESQTLESQSFESNAFENNAFESNALEGDSPQQSSFESELFETNAAQPLSASSSVSFADLNEWTDDGSLASTVSEEIAAAEPAPESFQEFEFHTGSVEQRPVAEEKGVELRTSEEQRREALMRQELESVDFYITQGYADIALDTLDLLERQFGRHSEITARREKLGLVDASSAASAAQPDSPAELVQFEELEADDLAPDTVPDAEALPVEIDDAFAQLESAASEKGAQTASAGASATQAGAGGRAGIDPGLAEIFDEFRTAVEEQSPTPTDEDFETHYNLGLAYQEMELLNEAIEELQTAANLVAPRDGTPRYLQCCNMLGHCFLRKDMPKLAAMWFKKGLDAPGHTEDEYQALRFELGTAYELMGDLDRAIDIFTEVYGINVSYRGVAEKLRELEAQKASK
ncbi:MAG TPA: tetratricopeptide repeat protein [Pyrinomonadaceae bacterium]|jgi:tetratricopeptide (TPR) repeat protein